MKPYAKSLSSLITFSLLSSLSLASQSDEVVIQFVNEANALASKACARELLAKFTNPASNLRLKQLGFTTFKIDTFDDGVLPESGRADAAYGFKASDQDKNEFSGSILVHETSRINPTRYDLRSGKEDKKFEITCSFPPCGLKYQITNRRGSVVDTKMEVCGGC